MIAKDVADKYRNSRNNHWRECWLHNPDRFRFIELLGTESLRSRRASDPPVHIPGDVAFELNCRRGRLDRSRPQPVSGDISPKQTVAIWYPACFDSKRYPHCRGDLKIIAAIEEPAVIVRDTHAPGLAYARHRVHRRRPLALFQAGLILKAKAVLQCPDDPARPALACSGQTVSKRIRADAGLK